MRGHVDPLQQNIRRLIPWIGQLRQVTGLARHRRLVVLSGAAAWCETTLTPILSRLDCRQGLWIGQRAMAGMPQLTNQKVSKVLGSETQLLVYDAFSGFDADAFGALSGTLTGGGLLFLLCPPLHHWSHYHDPEHRRIATAGTSTLDVGGRFIARLIRLMHDDPAVVLIEQGGALPRMPTLEVKRSPARPQDPDCRTVDQARAVQAVMHVATGHRRRPAVLIADRGRGKSAALGIAAARLLRGGKRRILVTAPRRSAASRLFEQAAHLLPGADSTAGALHLGEAQILFCAPDRLLHRPQSADLLLVDEAAALPAPLLAGLLAHYPRLAFATTVHGYEGTGQGFAVRFRRHLTQHVPQWREVRLETPIRWAADDPLERWLFRALALDASPAPLEALTPVKPDECRFEVLDRNRLGENERDLRDLFGLLKLAHYRTTPFDLRQLLDAPHLKLFALRARGRILAIAWMMEEGGFDASTAHAIWAGYRRPRGHLLAQSLAAHVGLREAPGLRGARIIRMAVHPGLQQRGFGSRLLEEAVRQARAAGLDYLGASFGATNDLLRFWRRVGFVPIRVGLRRGASSGTPSVIVLHALSSAGERLLMRARSQFRRQLPRLLAGPLMWMEADPARGLLLEAYADAAPALSQQDWLDLIGFAFARRGYDTALAAIEDLSLHALSLDLLAAKPAEMLLLKVLQKGDWSECARHFALSGRAALERELREILAQLILHYGDTEVRELALRIQSEAPQ